MAAGPVLIIWGGIIIWAGVIIREGVIWGGVISVTVPLDLTQLSCPGFTLIGGLPSGFTTDRVGCWGGALWRVCNLT
jgi:hypothetical protein